MAEKRRETKEKHIASLDCAKQAWENFEQTPITESDIQTAESQLIQETAENSQLIGHKLEKGLLCHFVVIAEKMFNNNAYRNLEAQMNGNSGDQFKEMTENAKNSLTKHQYMLYSNLVNKIDGIGDLSVGLYMNKIAANLFATDRVLNQCIAPTTERLKNIFQQYTNHLKYSECNDQNALESLQSIKPEFSSISYEEAVTAIGKIMDADDAAHMEL